MVSPPSFAQGSLNTYHGQHPLRERAKKLNQGILVIRFEMPYNVWYVDALFRRSVLLYADS